jgi:predicted metallopeptidase
MAIYTQAGDHVIRLANKIINDYHPHLQDARIAFVMRDEAPISNERATAAKASKVSDINKELMDYDFIIWIATDEYDRMTSDQHEALIDHELCHCSGNSEDGWRIIPHDIEEFQEIIERHGVWREDLIRMASTVRQLQLPAVNIELKDMQTGKVVTMTDQQLERMSN